MTSQIDTGMNTLEYLLKKTQAEEIVVFTDCGWDVGCTYIDHEDLFVRSLSDYIKKSTVKRVTFEPRRWAFKLARVLEIGE